MSFTEIYFSKVITFWLINHYRVKLAMHYNEISTEVIGCAIRVHRKLGPGLLESTYQKCLIYELIKIGLDVKSEVAQPIIYDNIKLKHGYRLDLLIDDKVVIELKATESLTNVHFSQLYTYLKLGGYKLGLLINFNVELLKDGIKRVVN